MLVLAGDAPTGGISDEPCPNVAGEHTNTCPPGKLGTSYSITFVETDGSGCGPGEQTFHFDSGALPAGLTLASNGTLSGTPTQLGTFRFYVEMREPQDDPAHCAGKRTQKRFTLTICRDLGIVSSPPRPPRAEQGVRRDGALLLRSQRDTALDSVCGNPSARPHASPRRNDRGCSSSCRRLPLHRDGNGLPDAEGALQRDNHGRLRSACCITASDGSQGRS